MQRMRTTGLVRACPGWVCVGLAVLGLAGGLARAEDLDFRKVVQTQSRQTVAAVRDYILTHADAPDRLQAIVWLFDNSTQYGLEDEALPVAEAVLADESAVEPGLMFRALAVRCMALARKQEFDAAQEQFEAFARRLRFQQAGAALELAHGLSILCRVHGQFEKSNQLYETVRSTFPLVPQVTEAANLRIARHELIGKAPPAIPGTDFEGKPFDWAQAKGKVVLVDFWATNCPPCLAAMPYFKTLAARYKDRGFEIVGVSFDENPALAQAFSDRNGLKWQMFMDKAPTPPVSEGWRVATIPAVFLVGRDGMVANADLNGQELSTVIEQLLAKE